ncbi:tRNA (34-2'-O)-methyltransferase regulator WDR6 [Takifugu rubripes]|uniref:tRNA (34-2'-O)-methyltransferase regulator WDR6 n=1 Tax=Takifugu rubripes TaxID=31033 RepID=A0A3B5KKX3_TAKRU|nr:WD repeat-containing protein 6 [Takifugu rubripes]
MALLKMETAALVAPVTALEFLQDTFLVTGEGPILRVYCLQPHPGAHSSLSVLQHYRIHGIRPRYEAVAMVQGAATGAMEHKEGLSLIGESGSYDLAVFGGKAVRLVRLHVDLQHMNSPQFETQSPLMELQDWILDVRWLFGDNHSLLCVAVAHNTSLLLDVTSGNVLVQRSCTEGCLLYSALLLVHESWVDTVLVGGTVFNQLILWKPGGGNDNSTSEDKAPVERRLLGHNGVIFSISYLPEKGWLASASDDRSVRVWDVGNLGGRGGKCGHSNPTCIRVLYGHQARVFSVCLSREKVFSAGEDGACLIWDSAGGGKVVRKLKGHRAGGVRALAVSEGTAGRESWVATGGADGAVRLWMVGGSEEGKEGTEAQLSETLSDLGFSGQGLPKVICKAEDEDENASWSQTRFVVCTDEGIVYQYSNMQWGVVWQGTPEFQSYCVMDTVSVVDEDSAEKVSLCAVGNLSGSIQVFPLSQPDCGILLKGGSGKIHSLIWLKAKQDVCLLASGAEGYVFRWSVKVTHDQNCFPALNVDSLPSFLLPPCAKRWLTAAVCLHSVSQGVLWVCGDRRGSLLLFQEGITNKREVAGEVNVCEPALHPVSCLFGVHGKQGVTSVREHKGLLYSTGRDGCVRVFRMRPAPGESKGGLQLEVLRVQRACRGMEWLERVLMLEKEIWEEEEVREGEQSEKVEREARFVIAGFQAVHFVVWDPVRQERLLAVPCGGGHRSWSLWPSHKGVWPGYGILVFIKQGAVLASQPPGVSLKAGRSEGWSLREGVHGRGIGCVCRMGRIKAVSHVGNATGGRERAIDEGHWEIVVTGGDDTSLTVLAVQPSSGSVKVLSVITDHISSVRTLTVATCQETDGESQILSALLVSAGGRAQVQCYRLLVSVDKHRRVPTCQVIQVAGHRLDEQWERRRNRHKTVKMDPETRYMSVVVLDENPDRHLLALACSDGALRLFSVREVEHQIVLLWETFYHQRCVLSVATCSLEDGTGSRYTLLFSSATDGKIAVWDLTEACSVSALCKNTPFPSIPCLNIPAHQSGINSLAVWVDKQDGGCQVTVASGGDDGQLTVSVIRAQYPKDEKTGGSRESPQIFDPVFTPQSQLLQPSSLLLHLNSQHHIPTGHAAPLTSLKLFRPGLVVSTSADQRVCLWTVGSAGISLIGSLCSHVADAAGLAVWEEEAEAPGDRLRKKGFHSEQQNLIWDGRDNETRMKTECKKMEAGSLDEKVTADESGPKEAWNKKSGPVYESNNREDEAADERAGNPGWVLVCGQGLQLLHIRDLEERERQPS